MIAAKSRAGTDRAQGLTNREAEKRLGQYGPNEFSHAKKISPWSIFASQFKDILIVILVVSTLLSVLMGEFIEAVAILLIILLNAVMGFVQEYRTERTLDALKNLAAPVAHVVRGGSPVQVPAAHVVPGDVVVLDAGDRVPSDAHLFDSADMQLDESLLTGESVPVEKRDGDTVFMGTIVTKGRGRAVTAATGMHTEMGKIAGMLTEIEDDQTPLQKRLAELGKYIAIGCLLICAVVTVTGILRGEPVFNMIVTGISLAVAAVPEGLPAIVTISLALGVSRMLKRNALIRRLPAVETLGCASVVCSDKTGTLTENRMTVREIRTRDHTVQVTGGGYEPVGKFLVGERPVNSLPEDVCRTLEIGAACNNAEIIIRAPGGLFHSGERRSEISGDPTEAALLVSAAKAGITRKKLDHQMHRLQELPFDSDRKCMSVVVRLGDGRKRLLVKGAPDVILEKCVTVHTARGDCVRMDSRTRTAIQRMNDEMADRAMRVLAMAYRDLNGAETGGADGLERDLTFAGLEGMIDPPRPEAAAAVLKCVRAGIRPVMITGDHKKTAAAIAREIGILHDGDRVLTGSELDRMSDSELARTAPHAAVFARVSPNHKLRIVRSYKQTGNVVAMTGDGVNDAPAVKEADIGVSMGRTGTDVTKEASSIILLDDNFASMVSAIEEGRVIYRNIRKFIRYLLSCNIGEVLTMFLGMLMGMPVVLLPIQILWVNLVTDGLPAIALSLEPPDEDVMEDKPRGIHESVFSNGLLGMMLFRGCIIGLSTLGAFVSIMKLTGSLEAARSAAFMTLVLVQLVHVFECKSETKSLLHIRFFSNPWLILACLISTAMILAALYMPLLQPIFNTVALRAPALLRILGYVSIGPVLSTLLFHPGRSHYRRRRSRLKKA